MYLLIVNFQIVFMMYVLIEAQLDGIGTDHHLLRAKVRIRLKCRKKTAETDRLKLDYEKLNNENMVAEFQAELLKHRNNTVKIDL